MEKLKKFSALLTAFLLLFSFIDANMFSAAAEPLKDYLFEKESFTYSETVDFKKFPEETNVKSLSGDVVAEFDLCIPSQRENEDSQMVENLFSDMSLQICDASNKAVSIFTIESKNGYERLRTRTVGNGTQQDFIAYADQVSIKDMWLNFKIEIDTENESVNYTISSDDLGESVEFNELAYYESDSNNQNNAITQVRIAFNRNKKTGFDETSDYYYCEYYIKELQVYSTYTISSIEDISDSVSVGSTFALPEKVSAVTSIGSEVECEVSWVDPVTGESVTEYTPQNEDVRVFYGTVSGYEETVTLTLTPTEPMISEIEPLEVTIFKYEEYQFPNKVTVTLQNNTTREKDVVWKDIQSFDASVVGQYTYEGEVADSDALASITINVVPLEIVSAEPVTINGIYGEYLEFPEKVEVLCADGTTVYEKVIWDIDINSLLDEGTHIISGDIIDCAIDVSAVIIIEKKDVQKDCMFNKETLDQFANLHNQEIILTTSPISTVDPYTYVQKDENGNYYLEYSETREYVSFSDSANKKTLYGDVVVEFDLKIEDSLKDMWIQVHDERKKPVAVITFDSRNGYERVTARLDEGSSTLTAVNFTDNINLKGQWLHFKINIDTIGREYDFRITGENSPAIVMRNVPYYSTDDNPDNDSILRTDIAFNRGVSADSFAASEYYSNKYLIDNIEIYRTYTVKEIKLLKWEQHMCSPKKCWHLQAITVMRIAR